MSKDNRTAKREKPPKNTTGKTVVLPDGRKVRNKQRTAYVRATVELRDQITEHVADMILRGAKTYEIKDEVRTKFNRQWQTAFAYMRRAKKLLRKRADLSPEEAKSRGVNVLLDVMDHGKNCDRVAAERRLGQIFGYDAPTRTELSGPNGEPLPGGNGVVVIAWPHEANGNGHGKVTIEAEAKQIEG